MGCKDVQITPEPPQAKASESPPVIPDSLLATSSVRVPVVVPFQTIQKALDDTVPSELVFDDPVECPETPLPREHDCKITGRISLGAARFIGQGNKLSYTREVRGRITFFMKWQIKIDFWPEDITDTREEDKNLHFRGTITMVSQPKVDRQWRVKPNLSGGIRFSEAYIHFGVPISVRGELTPIANRLINEHLGEIERDAQQSLDLRARVRPIWNLLSQPTRLTDDQKIWAVIEPRAAYMEQVRAANERIHFGLGLDFIARTIMGTPRPDQTRHEVPDLVVGEKGGNGFRLAVPFTVSYGEITRALNQELDDWETTVGENVTVTVDSVNIYGDRENVFVKAHFRARHQWTRAHGDLYFRGRPVLNQAEQQLKITDVDFDVNTANALVSSAAWLHRKALIRQLEKQLEFDVEPLFGQSISEVNGQLSDLRIEDRLRLSAEIRQASLASLMLAPDGFVVLALAEGTSTAEVLQL